MWSCILCSVSHWLPMITRQPLEIHNEKLTVHWKVIPHSIPLHDKQYYSNVMHKEDEVIKKSTDFKPLQKKKKPSNLKLTTRCQTHGWLWGSVQDEYILQ